MILTNTAIQESLESLRRLFSSILLRKLKGHCCEVSCNEIHVDASIKLLLSEEDISKAENYFFKVATKEVKQFVKENQYKKFSSEKDDILFYTGRILPSEEITFVNPMTDAMRDLASTTFCVPIIDKHSPIAFSIINDIHWNEVVKHSGIETT